MKRWHEDLITGVVLFAFYLALGIYMSQVRQYLPYDSLARLVSAWLVFYGTEVKLASIGFVWPPLPTLAIMPFVLILPLVKNWLAVVIVSALFMAISGLIVGHVASICGVTPWWRRVITLLFATNALIMIFGANGMSEAMLVCATLAACYWLIRFWQTDRNTHLILAGGFFGLLPLIRYEFAILAACSALALLMQSWKKRAQLSEEDFRNYLEGRLLAYSSLAIYPLFLWSLASWYIMGSPLYFIANDRSAVSLAEMQLAGYGMVIGPMVAFEVTFGAWCLAFALGTLAAIAALVIGIRRRVTFLVVFGLITFVVPFLQFIMLMLRANVPLLRYFIMAVPLGVLIAMAVLYELLPLARQRRRAELALMSGVTALFLASNVLSVVALVVYPFQNIEAESWKALTSNATIDNRNFSDTYAIGQALPLIIPSGKRVLIDTYQFGFALMLGAGDHNMFLDFTDPNYEQALKDPPAYVDYMILPSAENRGAFYAINRAHKKLYDEGASWAEFMDVLPQPNPGWKLYKVIRK